MKKAALLFPIILFLLHSCATMPKEVDLKESLKSKAEEYWKLRLLEKYEETYKMEEKSDLPPLAQYQETAKLIKKFKIESFYIDKTEVEGEKGTVAVRISVIKPPIPKPVKDVFIDEWIFKDGKWRHRFRLE
ncbi:MAG: hypothetical protein WC769_00920 [Thermodesulfovibrionales bacterium]|jgi:hypothetical protein